MNGNRDFNMTEATRLTRAGRLSEASRLISRTLADAPEEHRAARMTPPKNGHASAGSIGTFVDAVYPTAAGERRYKLYLPSGHGGAPLPLVVMLHGGTQGAEDFAAGTRMNSVAERERFRVVYPEQSAAANSMKYWNWFRAADQRRGAGEPALIAGITRQVIRRYGAGGAPTYVAGFSAGGAMAAVMAAVYPDLYAAVGVHSGLAYGAAHDVPSAFAVMKQGPPTDVRLPGEAIPLIVFQGDRDQTVDRVNGDRLIDQWGTVTRNGRGAHATAGAAPTRHEGRVAGGRSYTQLSYPAAGARPAMEQWIVHGGGHAWSGGGPQGSYTDESGPDASAEMARFFRQHAR